MQAPHSQSSQPSLVPVRPISLRITVTSVRCGSTASGYGTPLTFRVIETLIGSTSEGRADARGAVGGDGDVLTARTCDGGLDGASRHHADGVPAVLLARADVADRRGVAARGRGDRGQRLRVDGLADDRRLGGRGADD